VASASLAGGFGSAQPPIVLINNIVANTFLKSLIVQDK
jgi:hypothetical protein